MLSNTYKYYMRRVAEKATGGIWMPERVENSFAPGKYFYTGFIENQEGVEIAYAVEEEEDAEFIGAWCPKNALEILDENDKLRQELKEAQESIMELMGLLDMEEASK